MTTNGEVQFWKDDVIKVDTSVIDEMKMKATQNASRKFRYCFHKDESAGMQEMLFVISCEGYARPHKHVNVAESHVVIEGEGWCVLFNDEGKIMDLFTVSKKSHFLYRIESGIWHMVIPMTEQMVIYEIREGAFDCNTNIFPDWAPGTDENEIQNFKKKVIEQIKMRR